MKTILISDDDLQIGKLQLEDVALLISLGDLWDLTLLKAIDLAPFGRSIINGKSQSKKTHSQQILFQNANLF
jgi:hypothetical protein